MLSSFKDNVTDLSCNERNSNNVEVYTHHLQSADYIEHRSAQVSGTAISGHLFPVKLHYMLTELEKDGFAHIVSWQPHGRCFKVHNREAFVEGFLSNWFLQSKFTSFQRQLNLYGFFRIASGRDKGSYYHELFLRGTPLLACRISRTTVKGKGARKPASAGTQPDFYRMPHLPPSSSASTSAPVSVAKHHLGVGRKNPQSFQESGQTASLVDFSSSLYFCQHGQKQQNSGNYSRRALPCPSLNTTNRNVNFCSHFCSMWGAED